MMHRTLVFAVACVVGLVVAVSAARINPVAWGTMPEEHHGLSKPLDKSQVYWSYGGSTVMTSRFIRLTPSTQDRRGWLWNEYPIEAENWETEFSMEVFSKPHFGGDGMAFWILDGSMDPTYSNDPEALSGPIFGMKNDFKGVGVVFDVYDNDNKRNNPSVFVIKSPEEGSPRYNHDKDFEEDMYKVLPEQEVYGAVAGTRPYQSHKCVVDFRNLGKTTRVLVKYQKNILHVYVDTQEASGYKFCLAVEMPEGTSFKEHHIAFSAATGQVADNHDILGVTTRYLAEDDEFNDELLAHYGAGTANSTAGWAMLAVIVLLGFVLTGLAVYELMTYNQLQSRRIDIMQMCAKLNTFVVPHYALHILLFVILLVNTQWLATIINLPLAGYRVYLFATNSFKVNPALVAGGSSKVHGPTVSYKQRMIVTLAVYGIADLIYLYKLAFAR